jgi:hypothetical protein
MNYGIKNIGQGIIPKIYMSNRHHAPLEKIGQKLIVFGQNLITSISLTGNSLRY